MKVYIVLLLGEDERTKMSYLNLVRKLPYRFQEPEALFLAGILQFHQLENLLFLGELNQLISIGEGNIREEKISISSPAMTLEDILQKQIDTLTIHLISHGREDPIGALAIKPNPYQSIKVNAEALAKFFLHNRPSGTFEINLIDLIACNSLRLALCLSLLIPKSRIQGYEKPVVVQESGDIALYDPITEKVISATSRLGIIPRVRFISGITIGETPKMLGMPPVDFKFELAIANIKKQPEFQATQHSIQTNFFVAVVPEDSHLLLSATTIR